jgi:hypothetical protein
MQSSLDLARLYGVPLLSAVTTILSGLLYSNDTIRDTDPLESNFFTIIFAVMLTGFVSSLCLLYTHRGFPFIYRSFRWWLFGILVVITTLTQVLGFVLTPSIAFDKSTNKSFSIPLVILSGLSMCLAVTFCFMGQLCIYIRPEEAVPMNSV